MNQGYTYTRRLSLTREGEPLLVYLVREFPHSTEAEWAERIVAGEISVEGGAAGAGSAAVPALPAVDTPLRSGQTLVWRRPPWEEPDVPDTHWSVLHEDQHLLAVEKPGGLPTLPGAGFLENTLLMRVRAEYPGAVPVHRLGRWTSGLVLFARSDTARCVLAGSWRTREVLKDYRALCSGTPARPDFTVTTPIGPVPHPRLGRVHAASPDGKPSRSHFRVLEFRPAGSGPAGTGETNPGAAFLADVRIDTGRPHQVRIHAAAAGHPLVGDPLYGPGGMPRPLDAGLPGDPGYRLHAHRLKLRHPATMARLALESRPPTELQTATERA